MPAGNPPAKTATFYLVFSANNQLGAFGPRTEDISRVGLDNLSFAETGSRGDVTQVPSLHFAKTAQDARDFIESIEGLQGKEITLCSTSTDKEWMVFLFRAAGTYREMVDTDSDRNYKIDFQLEVQRTK